MTGRRTVVHIITRLEPGGSSRNTVDSCAAQAKAYDVVLLAGPHPSSAGLLKLLPPEVNYIEVPDLQREPSPLRDLRALLALRRDLLRLDPDIIHTHTSKAGALGRLAAALAWPWRRRAEVVHTPHGHLLYGYYGPLKTFLFRAAETLLAPLADRLVALTEGERRDCVDASIGRAGQWSVVHSGVDFTPPAAPAKRRDLDIHDGEVAVACVARLEPVKGLESLVRAAGLLKRERPALKLKYLVIGGGELLERLRGLADEEGVGGDFRFTGFRADAPALLAACDIYAQPSLNEGMGRAPLEAQALGLPAVVSSACGLPETVRPGETGLVFPAGDHAALAGALGRLAGDAALRASMGAAARAWALSKDVRGLPRFGPESMNAALLELYAGLAGDDRAPAP